MAPIPREKRLGFDYWKACECTHDYNHSLYYSGNDPEPKYWPGYDAAAQTHDAIAFIQSAATRANPFLLCLSLGPPHFPYATAPEEFRNRYHDREIQLRPNVPGAKRAQATEDLRGYYAHMAALDSCFARLFGCLERARIAEDTIVVFLSDHGDMMLSQGLTTKLYPWDESVRVPFLIRYPRALGRKGRRSATPFNMPDLMPTILSLAGLPVPEGVEGIELSRVCKRSPGCPCQPYPPSRAHHRSKAIWLCGVPRCRNGRTGGAVARVRVALGVGRVAEPEIEEGAVAPAHERRLAGQADRGERLEPSRSLGAPLFFWPSGPPP